MSGSLLNRQTEEFEDRNQFLYFLLGIISTARTLTGEGDAPAADPSSPPIESDAPPAGGDDWRDLLV